MNARARALMKCQARGLEPEGAEVYAGRVSLIYC
jgi:hypothetical protein